MDEKSQSRRFFFLEVSSILFGPIEQADLAMINRQFLLAARPQGLVKESDFEYREVAVPEINAGEVLIRTTYISLDPSMRGQMENRADYVAPLELGEVMRAGGVGVVARSEHSDYSEGDLVSGTFGMQDYVVADTDHLRFQKLDNSRIRSQHTRI